MPIINSLISAGKNPTGTKQIVSNGTHDVTDYANAEVNVPTTAPNYYYEYSVSNGTLTKPYSSFNFNGITTVGSSALYYFYRNISIPDDTTIDMSDITTVNTNGCQGMFYHSSGRFSVDLSGLTSINSSGCQEIFSNSGVVNVNLSNLTTINSSSACNSMFYNCSNLTTIDLSNLTTINGNSACNSMFYGCFNLTSVNLSNLSSITGSSACNQMFGRCSALTSVYLPKLVTGSDRLSREAICNQMFYATSSSLGVKVVDLRNFQSCGNYGILDCIFDGSIVEEVNLNALEHIGYQGARAAFAGNYSPNPASLPEIYFPMLTSLDNQAFYNNGFVSRKNLTIHFRKDMQATIEALTGYSTIWGAGSGTAVLFDLAGALTGADGNAYTRSEKDSIYASEIAGAAKTATAWEYNDIVYYTSGGAEPQVGDTIYNDSACTTAVTTISSIV